MNNTYESINGEFFITTDSVKINLNTVHQFLSQESYWAKDVPIEIVKRSIENSLCFSVFYKDQQIGFARVITDKATFAYLADVFIIKEYRGKGLSKWLLQTIHAHPELQGLRRWLLGTKDAHDLYTQFGWSSITEEQYRRFMQLHNANVYKQP